MKVELNTLRELYDLIVIGSGPAGLSVAYKYNELTTDKKTLIVESGDESNVDSPAQKLSVVTATGDLSESFYQGHNQRVFGGTSRVWHGWSAVLERRSFLNDEWPLDYDELYQYYPEAADILNLPKEIHSCPETPFPDNPNILYKPYYLSVPPARLDSVFKNFVRRHESLDILFNYTVTRIRIKNNVATSVLVRDSSNDRMTCMEIRGRKIVLAAGGVQNPRLLLLSLPNQLPAGHFFCEHPHVMGAARLIFDQEKFQQVVRSFPSTTSGRHAIQLAPEFSNAHDLLSVTFEIRRLWSRRPLSANFLGKNRKAVRTKMNIRAEMLPGEENHITLSNFRRDVLGQPVAHIALKFTLQAIQAACEHLNVELIRSGLGRISLRNMGSKGGAHDGLDSNGNRSETVLCRCLLSGAWNRKFVCRGIFLLSCGGSSQPYLHHCRPVAATSDSLGEENTMNRRRFLWCIRLISTAFIGCSTQLFHHRPALRTHLSYPNLPEDVQALYHLSFAKAFPDLTLEELIYELHDRGVCSETGFHINRVRMNSPRDSLVAFNGYLWTETELLLYAAIARLYDTEKLERTRPILPLHKPGRRPRRTKVPSPY